MRPGLRASICAPLLLAGCAALDTAPAPDTERAAPATEAVPSLRNEIHYANLRMAREREVVTRDPRTGESRFNGETIAVRLESFRFVPEELRLRSGTITRVRLTNPTRTEHYFGGKALFTRGVQIVNIMGSTIPNELTHVPVPPEEERDLYLFAREPGTYVLECFVPFHRTLGMYGTLIVEP